MKSDDPYKHSSVKLKFAKGGATNEICTTSFSEAHPALLVEVRVRNIFPEEISEAVGMYVALSVVSPPMKVPAPPDQIPVLVGPEIDPFNTTLASFEQTRKLAPASTVGPGVKTIKTLSYSGTQLPLPVDSKVIHT